MTLWERISASPEAFVAWLLSDKEAVCIGEDKYVGIETSVNIFEESSCNYETGEIEDVIDGCDLDEETREDLHRCLVWIINQEE